MDEEPDEFEDARKAAEAHAEAMFARVEELNAAQEEKHRTEHDLSRARLLNFIESLEHHQLDELSKLMIHIVTSGSARSVAAYVHGICVMRHWAVFEMEDHPNDDEDEEDDDAVA